MRLGLETVELGEGQWHSFWPLFQLVPSPKPGRGHGSAQLALFLGGGSLAKWGKKAASLWGRWVELSLRHTPRILPLRGTRTECLNSAFHNHPVLASGAGATPRGTLTVAN